MFIDTSTMPGSTHQLSGYGIQIELIERLREYRRTGIEENLTVLILLIEMIEEMQEGYLVFIVLLLLGAIDTVDHRAGERGESAEVFST